MSIRKAAKRTRQDLLQPIGHKHYTPRDPQNSHTSWKMSEDQRTAQHTALRLPPFLPSEKHISSQHSETRVGRRDKALGRRQP